MKYRILSGRYDTGTCEQKRMYTELFGEEDIEEKFELYFHSYNIIHEIGHILIDNYQIDMDNVDEELFANCFAIAYWKKLGLSKNLRDIKDIANNIIKVNPNLVPQNFSFTDYFKVIWKTDEMNTVKMYGYFQMACIIEAFKLDIDLSDLLLELGVEKFDLSSINSYKLDIKLETSNEILTNCLINLNNFGIKNLDVKLELLDNPQIQCCRKVFD